MTTILFKMYKDVVDLAHELLRFVVMENDYDVPVEFEDKEGNRYYFDEIVWADWNEEKQSNETLVIKIK
jgi:hypothetical protein